VTGFFLAAAAMLVAALGLILVPLLRRHHPTAQGANPVAPATMTGVITAIAMPLAAAGLYLAVTSYPWRGAPPEARAPADQQAELAAAIAHIEARLAAQPDDATGWRMLGRTRVLAGQFPQAVAAYEKAIALTGGLEPALQVDLAEALVLANEPAAQSRAARIFDAALAADPRNQKALWYSGLIALRADDPATAQRRFRALLAQNPPGEIRQILETQLAALDGAASAAAAGGAPAAARGRAIQVTVAVGEALASRLRPGVPVFVSARQPGVPGPPLAALRLSGDALPATVELSDANAMIAGRNLSSVDEVEITARVAFGGTATSTSGDLVGSTRSRRAADERVAITIDREVP
jgi:cytochrome c-type biogenesis protein CcmH